jgi:hypothetical protein
MAKRSAKKDTDTYSYKGWLISDKFHRRALAVFGYSMVVGLVVYGIILALLLVAFTIAFIVGFAAS